MFCFSTFRPLKGSAKCNPVKSKKTPKGTKQRRRSLSTKNGAWPSPGPPADAVLANNAVILSTTVLGKTLTSPTPPYCHARRKRPPFFFCAVSASIGRDGTWEPHPPHCRQESRREPTDHCITVNASAAPCILLTPPLPAPPCTFGPFRAHRTLAKNLVSRHSAAPPTPHPPNNISRSQG